MDHSLAKAFDLTGRVAVVTGAASGIGREAARVFAAAGAALVLGDVDIPGLAATGEAIGPACLTLPTDVGRSEAVDALAHAALDRHGRIDVWANVAGTLAHFDIVDAEEAAVDRVIAVNLKGVLWGCRAAGRAMKAAGSGSIINISSNGGDSAPPGLSAYAMTKAGVNSLTRSAARELGRFGVRANAVSPGYVETPLAQWSFRTANGDIDETRREEALRVRRATSPLGLVGEPSDIAHAMLYLASDASRFVTGQTLRVNGGVSMPL